MTTNFGVKCQADDRNDDLDETEGLKREMAN